MKSSAMLSGAAACLFALPGTIDLVFSRRPLADRVGSAAVVYAASLLLGPMLYVGLRGAGYRGGRPRPDQAADYGERE